MPEGSHITGAATMDELNHPLDTGAKVIGSTISGLNPWSGSGDAAQVGLKQMGQPGIGNKITGGVKYLESGIPYIGPSLVRSGSQIESGDYAGAAGSMVPPALAVAGMRGGGVTP